MRLKFMAIRMPTYKGADGQGGVVSLNKGEIAEVSDAVGKLLLKRYSGEFEIAAEPAPEHAPEVDKLFRKNKQTKVK